MFFPINTIIDHIDQHLPIVFVKCGDGEYLCGTGHKGKNCDNVAYTNKLRNALNNAYSYLVNTNNVYIGVWPFNTNVLEYLNNFKQDNNQTCAVFSDFFPFFVYDIDGNFDYDNNKLRLYKTIKLSKLKKIAVCNPAMAKIKMLLDIDSIIPVSYNSWFECDYDHIFGKIKHECDGSNPCIVIFSAGLGTKALIADLMKINSNNICLDIGSALDELCTGRNSRVKAMYDETVGFYNELIPANWNSDEFKYVSKLAVKHIRKV